MSRPDGSRKQKLIESPRQPEDRDLYPHDEEVPESDPWGTVLAVGISLFLVLLLCAITYFIGWAKALPFSRH